MDKANLVEFVKNLVTLILRRQEEIQAASLSVRRGRDQFFGRHPTKSQTEIAKFRANLSRKQSSLTQCQLRRRQIVEKLLAR